MNSERIVQSKRSGTRLLGRVALIGVALVALFAILGGYIGPKIARGQLEQRLAQALSRPVTIEDVRINPFTLEATVTGIRVGARSDRAGEPDLLEVASVYLDFNVASLWRLAPLVDRLTIERPQLALVRYAGQSYNISDLIETALKSESPATPFSISNIQVVAGGLTFDDRPIARKHGVTELEIGVPFLSNLPPFAKIDVKPLLAAKIDGHPIALTGETRPYDDPPVATLSINLDSIPLPDYMPYAPVTLPIVVQSGRLTSRLVVSVASPRDAAPEVALSGTMTLADLALTQKDGKPLIRAQSLRTDITKLDLKGRSLDLKTVVVDAPAMTLARNKDGNFNLAALFAQTPARGEASGPQFRFRIGAIDVTRGNFAIADEAVTPPYRSSLADVAFSASGVTNGPGNVPEAANFKLTFATDAGERFAQEGTFALSPFALDAKVALTAVDLKRLYPYYRAALNLEVGDGKVSATSMVHARTNGPDTAFTLDELHADFSALDLRLPGEPEPLWRIPSAVLEGGSVDAAQRVVQLGDIVIRGAIARIRRDPKGSFNFALMFKAPEGGATTGVDWRVASKALTLENGTLAFHDEAVTPNVRVTLSKVRLTAQGLGNARNAKAHVALGASFNRRGTISANGTMAILPFGAALNVTVNDTELPPLQPYIKDLARVVVTGGTAGFKGVFDLADQTPFAARFRGDVALADVTILDEVNNADLLRWKSLRLTGIDAATEPLVVSVANVVLSDYYARLVLDASGQFNLQQLARDRGDDVPPPAATSPRPATQPISKTAAPGKASADLPASGKGATTWLKVAGTEVVNGTVDFSDFFIRPNYSVQLTNLNGTASTLVFDTPAEIVLKGRIENVAPVEIVGRLNPLAADLLLDIKANARDVDLPALTPYSGKYAGYGIQKGKLSAEVTYKVENRRLSAQNRIILDQLTFGDRIDSPQATKLPIRLAVALLKDRKGVIDINLPIGGSLDDPQFSVGGIVIQAIVNLIVKIITSPFTLLASIGGHGEELAFVGFPAGSATLDAAAQGKLDALAKALNDRPSLSMEIAGHVDPDADGVALRHAAVERKVRQQKFNDLVKDGAPPASLDAVTIVPTEYDALLTRVYRAEPIPGKPTNPFGLPKDVPKAEMETALFTLQVVDTEMLRTLANRRAQSAKDTLVERGGVPSERIFVVAPRLENKEGEKAAKDAGPATRVDFALK